ncbi:hypothetical protein [Anaerocolumna jejuensis]
MAATADGINWTAIAFMTKGQKSERLILQWITTDRMEVQETQ